MPRASALRDTEDSERQVMHQVRDFRLALAPRSEGDEVLLRLLIALNSEE